MGVVRKSSKHEPTDIYLHLERYLAKCTMILNFHVGPVRTQMTNTQNINNSETSMQNNPNYHVYSTDKIKSKSIKADKIKLYIYSTDKSE